jgi:hypothetical protein
MAAAEQGIVLSRPAPSGYARALRNPLYDTDVLPAGAINQQIFFQRPQGQANAAATVKTEADTNMTIGGQLAQPQMFDIFGFQAAYMGPRAAPSVPVLADYRLIYMEGVFQFTFGAQRRWLELPMDRIPQGPSLFTTGATVAVQSVASGWPSAKEFYPFVKPTGKPYRIKAGETFQVTWRWPNAAITMSAAALVRTFIVGIYYIGL